MNYNGCKRKFDIKAYVAKWGSGPITAGGATGKGPLAKALASAPKPAAKPVSKPAPKAGSASPAGASSSSAGGKKKAAAAAAAPPAKKAKLEVVDFPF
jgi:deoxyribodipyrimidine photo-lyase